MRSVKFLDQHQNWLFIEKKNYYYNYKNSGFPFRSTNRILYAVTVLLRLLTCIVFLVSIRSNTVKKPKSLKSIIFESQGVIFFYCT